MAGQSILNAKAWGGFLRAGGSWKNSWGDLPDGPFGQAGNIQEVTNRRQEQPLAICGPEKERLVPQVYCRAAVMAQGVFLVPAGVEGEEKNISKGCL